MAVTANRDNAQKMGEGPESAARRKDLVFRLITFGCALLVIVVLAGILIELINHSWLSLKKFGPAFLVMEKWNPVTDEYGARSSIYGTLVSTAIALFLAAPTSLVIAVFLVEIAPPILSRIVGQGIELLAAIPSIIYGMWGLFVFAPFMAEHLQPLLSTNLGFLPLFKGPPMGVGILTAGIILALMVLPFTSAIMRDVLHMVPAVVKEAAHGMGATTWEVTWRVTLRYGMRGLLGACFLGLGRAVGETMAVTFVIGSKHSISASLFSPGNTIASTLANEFTEADDPLYRSALVELGLVLFLVTLTIQIIAWLWLGRLEKKVRGVT